MPHLYGMFKTNRRKFMAAAAAIGAGTAAEAMPPIPGTGRVLAHHVFFWLNNPGSEADRQQLAAALRKLAGIPQVKQLWVGFPAPTHDRTVVDHSYDVSELIYFDSVDDEAAYQVHPLHEAFVNENKHLWQRVVVYDTWLEPVVKS